MRGPMRADTPAASRSDDESCWMSQDGERRRRCPKEHSGGVHLIASEVAAVQEMFKRYSTGSTTLSQLAAWLNGSGLRDSQHQAAGRR